MINLQLSSAKDGPKPSQSNGNSIVRLHFRLALPARVAELFDVRPLLAASAIGHKMKDLQTTPDGKVFVTGRLGAFMESLQNESDRGAVIIVATIIEERLRATIREFLIQEQESAKLMRRNFQNLDSLARASLCLGLISRKELTAIDAIRLLRNEFAHQFMSNRFDGTLESSRDAVLKAVTSYSPGIPAESYQSARAAFDQLAVAVVFALWERADEVARQDNVARLRED